MNGGGVWAKIAIGACGILATLALGWSSSLSDEVTDVKNRVRDNEENTRSLHKGQAAILAAIESLKDEGSGGGILLPPLPPLFESSNEFFSMQEKRGG